ncbi:hypothetical protein EVAR_14381_1 [Eumeta japonica]|uniref:Uncharacterized protein n=1 Tax=Eumeta variegata TaxID=151549 RepID=A0A4C1TX27_EUMVA|nr:hypothetical protein EVAR_14381_1 [Eumeta japonica]
MAGTGGLTCSKSHGLSDSKTLREKWKWLVGTATPPAHALFYVGCVDRNIHSSLASPVEASTVYSCEPYEERFHSKLLHFRKVSDDDLSSRCGIRPASAIDLESRAPSSGGRPEAHGGRAPSARGTMPREYVDGTKTAVVKNTKTRGHERFVLRNKWDSCTMRPRAGDRGAAGLC